MDTVIGLAAVLLLILLNGFFVAGEFSLVAANRNKLEQLAGEGNRRALMAHRALSDLSFHLSGAQLGISVSSLLIGFITEPAIGRPLQPLVAALGVPAGSSLVVAVTLALAIATAVQMVIGELVPKNLAIARPVTLALAFVPPLTLWNRLFKPVIVMLNSAANLTVKAVGVEPRGELADVRSLEEIDLLIRASRDKGDLPEEDFSLLRRSISFGDKVAADALVPRTSVTAINHEGTIGDLIELSLGSGHSRFPVYRGDLDDVVGLAHVKDSYRIPAPARTSSPVTDIVQDAFVVPESRALESLLVEMRRERHQLAIVIDEYAGTAGILTIEDLLEEIVGDIHDEHDLGAPGQLTAPPSGVHVVSGMLHADELRDATGFDMPDGDYETLAGFLLSRFDRIPEQGEHLTYGPWELKVIAMERKRIARVLLVAPTRSDHAPDEPAGAEQSHGPSGHGPSGHKRSGHEPEDAS